LDAPEFVFVGEALALDFINTEVVQRRRQRDLLTSRVDVARWWDAARQVHSTVPVVPFARDDGDDDHTSFEVVQHLRTTLRRIFSAVAEQRVISDAALAHLSTILQLSTPALERGGDNQVQVVYQGVATWHEAVVFSLALSGFQLLTEGDLRRIHHCRNTRCILLFYDTTRSATRQWCSLGCMNRARSAQRYQQTKAHAPDD